MPTALLIEDDSPTAAPLTDLLTGLGFTPERHDSTDGAIASARARGVDLIVTDLWLGGRARPRLVERRAAARGRAGRAAAGPERSPRRGRGGAAAQLRRPAQAVRRRGVEHTIGGMLGPSGRDPGG
jgi:hypothetical protein